MAEEKGPEPGPAAFFNTLANAKGDGRYEPMDRYREFRAVFLGSDQGVRVLHEILRKCGVNRTSIGPERPVDPSRVMSAEGRRDVGLWMMGVLNVEPPAKPAKSNARRSDDD